MNGQATGDDPWILVVDYLADITNIPVAIVTFRNSMSDGLAALATEFHVG